MERDLIKSNQRFYYDGELHPGKLLKKSGENEINVKKFNAIQIGDRHFLLDPNISSEVFLNLQFRNGQYEYLYKSGDKIIVRDENGTEIMPTEWIEKGVKVMTPDGIGTVETVADNIALVKSAEGLKNYYIKNLKYAEATPDLQQYRKSWQIYEQILPQIQQEIKNDNTQLLKGAFMDAFNELDAKMPKKVKEPVVEPVETPKVEPVKVAPQDATPKVSLVSKIKNAFKKPKDIPAPPTVNEPAVNPPTVNVNHELAVPPPPAPKATSLDHLGKNYIHVNESNRAGQDNHVLTHIGLNPDTTNDNDKYLYHYEVGSHRDPIATTNYLDPWGNKQDSPVKGGIYVPGEEVINKTNGEKNTVVSHIDFNKDTGVLNPVNMLVKDSNGQTKSVPRGDLKLASHDRTKHSIVNTDNGNKHLHDVKEGDIINHKGDKHSVIYSDPQKGLATVNQRSGQMHFTSANNYHKPYLGQVKPEAKEGQKVQIGKKTYTIEHVSGEEEKGMSILSTTNKLGEKEYFEHPTDKLYDKILKRADLQEYEGDRFDPKASKADTEESDPKDYPHADMHDIDSAKEILELKTKHPNLSGDDVDYLKSGRGLNLGDINKMSPEEVKTILDKRPNTGAKAPDSNPMPETPLPQPVQEQQKQSAFDKATDLHDQVFGEHNKTVSKDGTVTHRVGIGDLAIKRVQGKPDEIINNQVPSGRKDEPFIIEKINPTEGKITYRPNGKFVGEDESKKWTTKKIEDFKKLIKEKEKLDPRADTDVRSKQVAHENDFQNKVYERVAKHLHEKGLVPTKENIDNELNTSNTGLRQSLEQYHKTYEANHNKEKAKGSIVDHPDYEKLDMDKTLSRVPNIEEKVKGELAKIKGSREEQRKKIKESLVDDIAKEYLKNGREYDEKPEVEPTQEDFDMHRKLGGTDQEVHEGVKQRMAELQGQQEYENKVEQGRQALKEGQLKAKLANEEREKMSDKEYLENIYNKKDNIKKSSLNEQVGVQQDKGKLAFNNNPNYHNTEFEYHIVPRNKITTSHTPIQGADSKVPFTPNAEHPASGQGREGYHSENIKGETDRKKVKDIADNPEFDQLINTSRSASEQAPPLIDARGHAINNGRFMAMDITSDENKKGYSEHLKSQLPSLFPNATPEQHEQMRASIDKMTAEGNTPMLTRVPINKTDGEAYDLGKHGEDYGKFASATNEGNIKALGESEKIKAVQNSLTDEDKNKLFSFIPEGRTIGNHIKDVKKADEILDHLQSKGIISDTERSTLYGDDRRLNDKGKKYLSDIYKNAYFDKEGADLLDKNKMIGQKVSDFHSRNSDELNEIKTHSKAYDLQHDIKDAFKSMIADKDQSAGQQKITEDSNVVKGLRYLMEYAGKGKDSEGVEYDDGKDALKKYIESVRKLKEGGGMFEIPEDEKDPKDFKEKYFDKYAKLFDQQKKIEANKQSSGKAQVKNQPKEPESKPDIHPAGELIKELQNDDKSVSVENEKPDNSIENKEDNISSEKSVDPSLESSKAYIDDEIKAINDSLEKGHFNPRDSRKLTFKLDKEGNIKDVGHHVNKNDNETVVAEDHPDATWKSSEHSDLYTERHGKEIKAQHKSLTDLKALLESDLPGKLLSAAKKVGGLKQLGKELYKHGFDKVGNSLTLSDSSKPSLHHYIVNHSDKADSIKDALKEIDGGSNKDNISSEKSVGDINNLPDGRFEVSEPDGGKANFTDESKAKEYSKVLKQQEELKNKFEQDEPNVIYDSKNDLSNHPEAKRYENFPDKKIVTWGQGNYKGIHPDNIMHFNQGGANSRYGRVSFIAPSEHKFKKHEQYKKLAREMREEGKDVIINAFKNPSIVAKINKMGKSFEPEEQSYWDELRKSFEDPEPSNRSPYPMTLESENVMPKLSNTASGQQHLATLKNNGVPEEELHTTGLHNLLNTDKKIPKTDIQDHLRHNIGKWNKENVEDPQHEQYSLPGGHTNYREVLHTYTEPDVDAKEFHRKELNKKIEEHYNPSQYHLERYLTPEEKITHKDALEPVGNKPREQWEWALDEAQRIVRSRMDKEIEDYSKTHNIKLTNNPDIRGGSRYDYVLPNKPQTWNQGHYIPNNGNSEVIYHQRFNNRQTPEGKKVTHMEEQQSDIHQAGREVGYDNEETQNKRKELSEHLVKEQEKINAHPDIQRLYKMDNVKLHEEDIKDLRELAKKYNHNLDEQGLDIFGKITGRDYDDLEERIRNKISPDFESKLKETQGEPVPDVPLKGNKWKEHGFKQALMEAVKDNSDYLSWTTGDQQFKRWGSINVNWQPHKSKEGWNVNIKGRHDDSDLSRDYHVNSLEDVKKLPGEAGSKWSEKIWDRIQKQPEGADYEPLRHGMNKEYSEVLPNIAKKYLKKFGIHPEDIELGEYNTHEKLDKILQDHESDIAAQNDYPKYAEVVEKMHSALSSGKSIKEASDELSKQTDSDQEQDIIDDIMVKLTEHEHSLQSHKYVGKEHSATEIKNLGKEIKASDRYSRYVQTTLSNKIQQLLTDTLMPPNDDDRSHPFATAVNHALGQAEGDPDIYRLEEIVKMLHPDNQIKPFKKPATKVHAVKITPELREHIIKNGFSMYKSFDEFEEPLQKSNINYPERIHAMRNRRGENISSIAVMNGDKILMGRRRDSDKWTLPGGHAEEGETAEQTGIRELEEETGIKAKKLESLGSEEVKNPNAPELMINCFKYETDESTSMRDDPDTEVKKWVWVSTPISQDILDNLHAKKNVTLKLLGLQNWEKSFVYQMKTAFNNLIKLLS